MIDWIKFTYFKRLILKKKKKAYSVFNKYLFAVLGATKESLT